MTQNKKKTTRKNDKKSIVNVLESGYNEEQGGIVDEIDYSHLTLANDFIFFKVMQDSELCKKLLEIILEVEIERIEYSEVQKKLKETYQSKGVQLDVYLKDGKGTVYNVEMQATNPGNLPKRSRYYQDLIDIDLLTKGTDYRKLRKSYVIFICMEDVFKQGRPIYTFENRCIQDTDIVLGDETAKMFLNPHSDMNGINSGLANFLRFLIDGKPVDEFTERLAETVETIKNNIMLDVEYKAFYAKQLDKYDEGLKVGLSAMIKTLKPILKDFDKIYDAVTETEEYADITREEVMEYYQKCP